MNLDASTRETDARVLAVMLAMFAVLVGLIGMSLATASLDASPMQPVRSAYAAQLPRTQDAEAKVAAQPADHPRTTVTPEENWAADESSHGLRPDAAH